MPPFLRYGLAAVPFLFNTGLQVSGISNTITTAVCWSFVLLILIWAASHNVRQWRAARDPSGQMSDSTRSKLVSLLVGTAGVAVLMLVGAFVGLLLLYRAGHFEPKAPEIVVNLPSQVSTPVPSPVYGKLAANEPPDISADVAKRVARYWQLKDAIPRSEVLRKQIEETGTFYRDKMNPKKDLVSVGWVSRWQNALTALQKLNDSIYKNRPLDLKSAAPEMAYPTARAPHEDDFNPEDAAAIYRYRSFHFLLKNIIAQSDTLTADMKKEAVSIRRETIESVPAEQLEK